MIVSTFPNTTGVAVFQRKISHVVSITPIYEIMLKIDFNYVTMLSCLTHIIKILAGDEHVSRELVSRAVLLHCKQRSLILGKVTLYYNLNPS